jgi:hypothetical protein
MFQSSKSCNYCNTNRANPIGIALLCEVALGNECEKFQHDYNLPGSLPKGKSSVKVCHFISHDHHRTIFTHGTTFTRTLHSTIIIARSSPQSSPHDLRAHLHLRIFTTRSSLIIRSSPHNSRSRCSPRSSPHNLHRTIFVHARSSPLDHNRTILTG